MTQLRQTTPMGFIVNQLKTVTKPTNGVFSTKRRKNLAEDYGARVIKLRDSGLTYPQIGEKLGITTQCAGRIYRALKGDG